MRANLACLAAIAIMAIAAGLQTPATTIDTHFSPNQGCAAAIEATLAKATTTLDVAAYEMTQARLSAALQAAQKRGVTIRVLVDRSQEAFPAWECRHLRSAAIPVMTDRVEKIMHNKYAIIDGQTVITGSYNWSDNAEVANAENIVIITDAPTAAAFTADFAAHWAHSTPYSPAAKKPHKNPLAYPKPSTNLTGPQRKDAYPWHALLAPSIPTAQAGP